MWHKPCATLILAGPDVESIEEEADLDGSHEREEKRGRRAVQLAELRIFLKLAFLPRGRPAAQAPLVCVRP